MFRFGSRADYENAKIQIATAGQGGLGLPTPDYYSKPDYADLRKAYAEHAAKLLQLTGIGEAPAREQAEAVLKLETRLAAASLSRVELRDPEKNYNKRTLAQLVAIPGIGGWTASYIAMRALRWPDAFLEGDLVVRRALGVARPAQALALAEAWRPWRAYAVIHLWRSLS